MKRFPPPRHQPRPALRPAARPYLEQIEARLPTGVMLALPGAPWVPLTALWSDAVASSEVALPPSEPNATSLRRIGDDSSDHATEILLAAGQANAPTNGPVVQVDNANPWPASTGTAWDQNDEALAPLSSGLVPRAPTLPSSEGATLAAVVSPGTPPATSVLPALETAASPVPPTPPGSALLSSPAALPTVPNQPASQGQRLAALGQLPLRFEANQGQTNGQVQFVAPGGGYTLFLTAQQAVFSLHASTAAPNTTLHMQVVGANANAPAVGEHALPGTVNYFLGNDPAHWHADIPTYAQVKYPEIYPGVDLVYYGNQQQLEYDFAVRPGADPTSIRLAFPDAQQVRLDPQGNLLLDTAAGTVQQHKPVVYEMVNGVRQEVTSHYLLEGGQQVGFQIGSYDATQPLVIDPVLEYATYLGGSVTDVANGIAVDAAGNIYVTGDTGSMDFPTANPLNPVYGGGISNVFVAKLDPTGSTLLYATYLGGEASDHGNGLAVDAAGNVYVVGRTNSRLFPITSGAFEDVFRGDEFDAFVAKISPAGDQLNYATYLGGDDNDSGIAIAVDAGGNAYVTGGTKSYDFPVTRSAYQGANFGGTNVFVTELNATGTDVVYSTFLGGSITDRGNAIAVDANGFVYVAGQTSSVDFPTKNALQATYGGGVDNAFVAKFDPHAAGEDSLLYATFLGGSSNDRALGLAVDGAGDVYLAGQTSSVDFPVVNALQPTYGGGSANAFVAALDPTGTTLRFATYLGGSVDDRASGLALDPQGNLYVTGSTASPDFPTLQAFQPFPGGGIDAFVTKLTPDGSALVYSSYLGGSGDENRYMNGVNIGAIAVDAAGNAYVAGQTTSSDFPTVNPVQPMLAGGANAFIAKIADP